MFLLIFVFSGKSGFKIRVCVGVGASMHTNKLVVGGGGKICVNFPDVPVGFEGRDPSQTNDIVTRQLKIFCTAFTR